MYYIYKIQCHNKYYIGQTNNFKRRCWEHKDALKKQKHSNKYLQEDYNCHGLNSFNFSVLDRKSTRKEALKEETKWINYYGGIESDNVYNFQDNITENKEMKNLVSENQKGKYISEEQKQAVSKAHKGKKDSLETRIKKSKARIGSLNPNFGNTKYSKEFIQILKSEYENLGSYIAVARKYNISACSVSNLIRFGLTRNPNLDKNLLEG